MQEQLPESPPCTPWCRTPDAGWDVSIGGTTKTCRCVIESADDEDGQSFALSLERFAYIHNGTVHIEEPLVEMPDGSRYRKPALIFICDTIRRAADLIDAPSLVA